MRARKLVAAALLLGLAVVIVEESYVHSDDGCALETHCNACLLQLGTPVVPVVAVPFAPVLDVVDRVAPRVDAEHDNAAPRGVPSRGPPSA